MAICLPSMDIEKAFDSMDFCFLLEALKKFNFDEEFIKWIEVLINKQESCVFNGGVSTGYFSLERGAKQGDPISAYLFILVMEIFFTMARQNENIDKLEIFGFKYLLTAYADDSTFFVKNQSSAKEIFETFNLFSKYSGLKVNKSKCEFAGIGAKNGVQTALSDVTNINLKNESIRVLGVHFTYNEDIFKKKNFIEVVEKIERVLAVWRWRNLSLTGKITIFKTLAFSKIVFISFLNEVPMSIVQKLENIQKEFIWCGKNAKIKHTTLIADYAHGGLKSIDIKSKFESLQLSWIKRLFCGDFHPWKNIPEKFIKMQHKTEAFFPNSQIDLPENCPKFYKGMAKAWSKIDQEPITAKTVASQRIWKNKFIKIGGKTVNQIFPFQLFIGDLFDGRKISTWQAFKNKNSLENKDHFKWIQIVNAIPKPWIKLIENHPENGNIEILREQHLNLLTRLLPLEKLTSKQIYGILIHQIRKAATSQRKICEILNTSIDKWDDIYTIARRVSVDNYTRMFHYKCAQNILYLNNKLFKMNLAESNKCSLCKTEKESIKHLFFECQKTKALWESLKNRLRLLMPDLTPESAFFGFPSEKNPLIVHLHLIFKIAIYTGKDKADVSIEHIINKIKQIKKTEENIVYLNHNSQMKNNSKWADFEMI